MGSCMSCFKKKSPTAPHQPQVEPVAVPEDHPPAAPCTSKLSPTREEVITSIKAVKDANDVDALIKAIDALLQSQTCQKPAQDEILEEGTWKIMMNSGYVFLKFVNDHIENIYHKDDSSSSGATTKIPTHIVQQIGSMYWMVGGLSTIAYLLRNFEEVSQNRSECLQLLQCMLVLANQMKMLRVEIPEEEEILRNALLIIVEGCIICAAGLHSKIFLRFLKASVISETLGSVQNQINRLNEHLTLRAIQQLPLYKSDYTNDAVGIEDRIQDVMKLLELSRTTDELLRAVVIHGLGGIGKTTLATAVVSRLDLKDHNFARVMMDVEPAKNDLKIMQLLILKDGFPNYTGGGQIMVRDCEEGREHLIRAFKSAEGNKPLFLFIDNALRVEDLAELLPADLRGLPKGSRILVTTRNLDYISMFLGTSGLPQLEYLVNRLPDSDAVKILCPDEAHLHSIKAEVEAILRKWNGIPLFLKIAASSLKKEGYSADSCRQILNSLGNGEVNLMNFIYRKLEPSTQQAFLDICFYTKFWTSEHIIMKCIVAEEDRARLEDAAFVTMSKDRSMFIVSEVIREEGFNILGSSRIKDLEVFRDTVKDQARLFDIKGIHLISHDHSRYVVKERHLNSMKNSLRVLALGDRMKVSRQSQMRFKELRYLRIGGDIPSLPMNLEALPMLAVYEGPLFKGGVSMYKLPASLRVIKAMRQSDSTEFTESEESNSMQEVQNSSLEKLDLTELRNLKKLPEGLHQLNALKILIMDYWIEMEELPEQVCRLRSLTNLSMRYWRSLKRLPESFGDLKSLTDLDLSFCSALDELPSTFVQLTALHHLHLIGCDSEKGEKWRSWLISQMGDHLKIAYEA